MAPVERVILATPVLGPALEAILMTRVSLGLRLTLGAGLPIPKGVARSLEASASALYQRSYQKAKPGLRKGEELTEVLTRCKVFPPEFLDVVANAEEGGRVPEVMATQVNYYREESERRLRSLTRLASAAVYLGVGLMILWMIVKIFTQAVAPAYNMATGL
jgi:type II secretory pathway component PulF